MDLEKVRKELSPFLILVFIIQAILCFSFFNFITNHQSSGNAVFGITWDTPKL